MRVLRKAAIDARDCNTLAISHLKAVRFGALVAQKDLSSRLTLSHPQKNGGESLRNQGVETAEKSGLIKNLPIARGFLTETALCNEFSWGDLCAH